MVGLIIYVICVLITISYIMSKFKTLNLTSLIICFTPFNILYTMYLIYKYRIDILQFIIIKYKEYKKQLITNFKELL